MIDWLTDHFDHYYEGEDEMERNYVHRLFFANATEALIAYAWMCSHAPCDYEDEDADYDSDSNNWEYRFYTEQKLTEDEMRSLVQEIGPLLTYSLNGENY